MIEEALPSSPPWPPDAASVPANLSGGQQQMLALAMATITRPKLFLIDELSLGLSPIVVEQLLGAIESIRQSGTAILLVEQSMNVAVAVADRVYVMETGVVRFSGTAEELAGSSRGAVVDLPAEGIGVDRVPRGRTGDSATPTARRGRDRGPRAVDRASAATPPSTTCPCTPTTERSSASSAPTGPARRRSSTSSRGSCIPTRAGSCWPASTSRTARASARARSGLGRSFQDSRLFSGLTVRDALAVSLERFTDVQRPLQRHAAPPAPGADRGCRQASGSTSSSRCSASTASPTTWSASSRPVPRRLVDLAAVVAHQPSRGPARRALFGRRPARGRGHGRAAAQPARPARRDLARRRARHRLHRRAGRSPGGHGPRRRAGRAARPARSSSRHSSARPSSARTRSRCPARARWTARARLRPRTPSDLGGGHPMSDGQERDPEHDAAATERPWPRVEPAAQRGTGRPHRRRAGGRGRLRHRARAQRRHGNHRGRDAGRGARSAVRRCRSPMPPRPRSGKAAAYNWGPQCDHRTGRLKMPTVFSPPCVPVPTAGANNGGATIERGDGDDDQPRLLPGPAGRPDLRRPECRGHTRPGARHRAGLRGHVQPRVRDLRAPREPDPVPTPRARKATRWRPTPTP